MPQYFMKSAPFSPKSSGAVSGRKEGTVGYPELVRACFHGLPHPALSLRIITRYGKAVIEEGGI